LEGRYIKFLWKKPEKRLKFPVKGIIITFLSGTGSDTGCSCVPSGISSEASRISLSSLLPPDSTYERTDGNSGREHLDGIGIQLVEDTREDGLSNAFICAVQAIGSASLSGAGWFFSNFSIWLSILSCAAFQRRQIEERAAALYAGEIPIPESVIDDILRTGGNRAGSQLRIIYNFMSEQAPEEYTEFVKLEYRKGGKGFQIDGSEYSVWFDETGMQIVVGHTVTDQILDHCFLLHPIQTAVHIHPGLKADGYVR